MENDQSEQIQVAACELSKTIEQITGDKALVIWSHADQSGEVAAGLAGSSALQPMELMNLYLQLINFISKDYLKSMNFESGSSSDHPFKKPPYE